MQDRTAQVLLELVDSEELDQAVLEAVHTVVISVEQRLGVVEVDPVLGGLVPGLNPSTQGRTSPHCIQRWLGMAQAV